MLSGIPNRIERFLLLALLLLTATYGAEAAKSKSEWLRSPYRSALSTVVR